VSILTYFVVTLGSAAGGTARYAAPGFIAERTEATFPWGTFLVNLSGSFLIGLFFGATGDGPRFQEAPLASQIFTYGFLGGYSTFSTFTIEALNLLPEGEHLPAWTYMPGSVVTRFAGAGEGHGMSILLP
jgi:fluoride exporter